MNQDVQDLIQQGVELMAAERFEAAKELFERVLEMDKKNYDAYVHLGNACVNLEMLPNGIAAFKKAELLCPDSTEVLYSLGCAFFLEGDYLEAIKKFNQCEEKGFRSVEMYGVMEIIFLDSKDYVQALRCANRAIRLEPLNPQPYLDKAQLYLLQDKPKEAIGCLRDIEELLPDAAEPYLLESQIFLRLEEHEQALEAVDRAVARFPCDPSMLLAKARTLNSMERYKEAGTLLKTARELALGDTALLRDIAVQESVSYAGMQDIGASIASLEGVVADTTSDRVDEEALFLLANECYAMKQYEKAEKYAKQLADAPDADPRFRAAGIFWSASSLKELGRSEEAAQSFRAAVGTLRQINIGNPGLLEVYLYRAMSHKELGEYEKALDLVDHIINLTPDDAVGYAFKADILAAKGDEKKAEELRAKALSLDPNFEF